MKSMVAVIAFLFASLAFASPITVDQIYGPDGLTITSGRAVITLPVLQQSSGALMTTNNAVTMSNKTFDKSSNVYKQARFVYDFASLGGASDTQVEIGSLPAKAIVVKAWIDMITQPTSAGSATVGISSKAASDILADTAIASLAAGQIAGKPDGSTTKAFKLSGASTVKVDVKADALSGGKFVLFLDYLISE